MCERSFIPVPERPSDFADYFQREFYRRMNEKAAAQLESGVAGTGLSSVDGKLASSAGLVSSPLAEPAFEPVSAAASTAASSAGASPGSAQ